jgi:dipeptidase
MKIPLNLPLVKGDFYGLFHFRSYYTIKECYTKKQLLFFGIYDLDMILLFILLCLLMVMIPAFSVLGCFAVVVGKKASSDGSVIFGHNEQDGGERILNFRVIPRMKHNPDDMVRLVRGGTLPEVSETYSFIWSENPCLEFSDTYINEWGVAVASDGCGTSEDSYDELVKRGDIVDGGIGYMLRRLIIQRAKTAREGIQIAGELLGHFGYADSGRTLVIADPNEGWLLSIVRGKHWVAQRVPDDEVVILPNVHIISKVNLEDADNFMGASDIVDYAIKRGWYDPSSGRQFSFRDAYNPPNNSWDPRQWRGQSLVTTSIKYLSETEQLPFSVRPDYKFSVKDVIDILRYHGDKGSLCAPSTLEGAVFQLRHWIPPEVGCVYWRTSAEPCTSVLIPWYLGITEIPEEYHKPVEIDEQLTIEHHLNPPKETFDYDPNHAWWTFKRLQDRVNSNDQDLIKARETWDEFERNLFADQAVTEVEALKLLSKDKDHAKSHLTNHSRNLARKAAEMADEMYDRLRHCKIKNEKPQINTDEH